MLIKDPGKVKQHESLYKSKRIRKGLAGVVSISLKEAQLGFSLQSFHLNTKINTIMERFNLTFQ